MSILPSGIAVAPMTCAPDAFNSGAGTLVLEPGQEFAASWGITPGWLDWPLVDCLAR